MVTTTPPPVLALDAIAHLKLTTQTHYRRVFAWLTQHGRPVGGGGPGAANYTGPWDRTEPLQQFLNEHPNPSVRTGIRGRICQCLLNRYVQPRPIGPPIFISTLVHNGSKAKAGGNRHWIAPLSWTDYLPRSITETCTETPTWREWWEEYIVRVLDANPLRRNLVRAYVSHVHRVLCPGG